MKENIETKLKYFTVAEWCLWGVSAAAIVASFLAFDRSNYRMLIASLLGVTSLIFNAKGNPIGQLLMVIFSVLYAVISYSCAYYGEMLTYVGMTAPMALFSLIAWMRHPYQGKRSEVAVNEITKKEILLMLILSGIVTFIFYWILAEFETANLLPSTISVTTSFLAVYLTFRRSAYFALAYAANDMVLIVLWVMAARNEQEYLSVVVCFVAFLASDLYGYVNWRRMQDRQKDNYAKKPH